MTKSSFSVISVMLRLVRSPTQSGKTIFSFASSGNRRISSEAATSEIFDAAGSGGSWWLMESADLQPASAQQPIAEQPMRRTYLGHLRLAALVPDGFRGCQTGVAMGLKWLDSSLRHQG